jgi:hypothetical protein
MDNYFKEYLKMTGGTIGPITVPGLSNDILGGNDNQKLKLTFKPVVGSHINSKMMNYKRVKKSEKKKDQK